MMMTAPNHTNNHHEGEEEAEQLLPFDSSSKKIEERWVLVRVPSTGLRHLTGISSSYSTQYPEVLQGVISKQEFEEIFERLNETIRDYWPCDTCYFFGYGCFACTVGLSVLLPHYCATHSEKYANAMLRNVTLKSKFYDRRISFALVKSWCHSFVEIRIPAELFDAELLTKHRNDPSIQIISSLGLTYNDEEGQERGLGRIDSAERGLGASPDAATVSTRSQPSFSPRLVGNTESETSRKKAL